MSFLFFPKSKREENGQSSIPSLKSHTFINKSIFSTLFHPHPEAVFTLNLNGQLCLFNPSLIRTFQFNESKVVSEFSNTMKQSTFNSHFKMALKGQAQNFKDSVYLSNGSLIHLDFTLVPLLSEEMETLAVYGIALDVTKHKKHEEKMQEIVNKFEMAQKSGKIGSWDYDIESDSIYWSKQLYELTGRNSNASYSLKLTEGLKYVHPEDQKRYRKLLNQSIQFGKSYDIEFRILREDNSVIYVSENVEVVLDEFGRAVRLIGNTQDITKRKLAEKKLRETESRINHIYDNLPLGIRSVDVVNNKVIFVSPGITEITGLPAEGFYEREAWDQLIHPDDHEYYQQQYSKILEGKSFNIEYRIFHQNGDIIWVQDKTVSVFDHQGKLIRTDGILTNITEKKQYEEKINRLAYYDAITGLPNRSSFIEKIDSLIEVSKPFSILYIQIDRFRNINSSLGHIIGDQLLQHFSNRIDSLINGTYYFARISGGKFGLILPNTNETNFAEILAKSMIDSFQESLIVDGYELYLNVSIGISNYPSNGGTREELLHNTNTALKRAEALGKNTYHIYSPTISINSFKHYELERDLRKSIENNELILYFQPRVETSTGRIVGAEALIRWQHPVWGLVSPGEFIPIAEESGFINEISNWVLENVCKTIAKWKSEKLHVVPISINVTSQRFLKSDWLPVLLNSLNTYDIDPSLLEFEITETTLLHYEKEVEFAFQYLKELGVKLAFDDFGTGYSSLTHLKDFSIDTIKIDKSFIQRISEPNIEMIIKSLIFMGKGLEMTVVAEGVETIEQFEFLRNQECSEIQGYLFSEPVPVEKLEVMLKRVILKPAHFSGHVAMEDRREFYRVDLLFPLSSDMTLTSFQGKNVNLGKTEVVIENISAGGLRFLSTIQLPVRPDIIYQFETTILEKQITMNGHVVWKQEVKDGFFQYGVQFIITEKERDELIKILNQLTLQLKKNAYIPGCSFIQDDKFCYLRKANRIA
ncbi:diguanylate cyclase (GGDEF)-like protein/PAS domain S-box-containing protein [Lysinibacillus composti]|uniref:EAL domain-containing protein n=1 Tax=Lysinibacillus composti TaxID=720633 RepID=A0A3N9UI33_9BACI|nr:EAL domain-containing protein [Lysinibacillus composti]MBM7607791.1 diguanylate cyclase (GGDEF)-like protein/PAS domain S-box-containing protein [Lysinibacillus composti]RQW75720.1 EAL domain-containing protein [Lysinibacillus composti]